MNFRKPNWQKDQKMGQKGSKVVVQGEVAAGYESVKAMFQENFE